MINETIRQLYIKGTDDRFHKDYIIIHTDKNFYEIYPDGFKILGNPRLSEYRIYDESDVSGAKIVEIYANVEILYILLSDNRLISFGMALDGSMELLIEGKKAYEELKDWFESEVARETDLQKLSLEHPRWKK